ncbi:MAG: hypothetical protein J5I93_16475 [Pirellulaceae bacterium]|nr:hypothetical protein [Pirellulaceae bacterium]
MAHDVSHLCPCGSGRKVKFCCGKAVAAELEKIQRAIHGDQRAAALNLTRLARQKWPDIPALLAIQAELELMLGEHDAWPATVQHLARVAPDTPSSHALSAIRDCDAGRVDDAMAHLQAGLEAGEKVLPGILYEALGLVAQAMLTRGNLPGGLSLLRFQSGIAGQADKRPAEILEQLDDLGSVPFLFRYQRLLRTPGEQIASPEQTKKMLSQVGAGRWRQARQLVEQLRQDHPQDPDLLYNLGVLNMRLGDLPRAAESWRQFAALPGLPLDEAVEAEAMAQLVEPAGPEYSVRQAEVVFRVTNTDQALERLLSSRRLSLAPEDAFEPFDEDDVPPKAAFWLLDREPPASGADVTWREIPNIVGEAMLFGRQTEREARLEAYLFRDSTFDERKELLQATLGDAGHWESETDLEGQSTDPISHALNWRWRIPEDMPAARSEQAIREKQQALIHETVPRLALPVLDGKCLAEVAGDPAYWVRALGLLLNLELQVFVAQWQVDLNALRRELGLPERATIRGPLDNAARFPLERVPYVQLDSLSDDELLPVVSRCFLLRCWPLLKPLADEVERRGESLVAKVNRLNMHAALSGIAPTSELTLEQLQKAADLAEASGISPASFLLAGLVHQLRLGRKRELQESLQRLNSRHMREPGVAEQVRQFMAFVQQAARAAGRLPGAELPASDQAPTSKLWTPDSDTAPAAGGGKSKLWVPGMD